MTSDQVSFKFSAWVVKSMKRQNIFCSEFRTMKSMLLVKFIFVNRWGLAEFHIVSQDKVFFPKKMLNVFFLSIIQLQCLRPWCGSVGNVSAGASTLASIAAACNQASSCHRSLISSNDPPPAVGP